MMSDSRYGTWLLAAGALVGVTMAAHGLVRRQPDTMTIPPDAIAVVNGAPIQRADYQRALVAVASGRRDGRIDDTTRMEILGRLIDEELLVQRGLELRLAERDPLARTYLSGAVISLIVARGQDDASTPEETELRAFFSANQNYFRKSPRLRVEQIFFRAGSEDRQAYERAMVAKKRLTSSRDSFDAVGEGGDSPTSSNLLPNALLPPAKIRDYLGPTVTSVILSLAPGEVSDPIRSAAGYHIVRVVESRPGSLRPFDEIRPLVVAEFRRREGDRKVQQLLEERRDTAKIAIARELL